LYWERENGLKKVRIEKYTLNEKYYKTDLASNVIHPDALRSTVLEIKHRQAEFRLQIKTTL